MKIREILAENTVDNIEADLNSLLIALKANGLTDVPTERLVMQLRNYGYSIDNSSILDVLEGNPMVQVATVDNIQFANNSVASASGDENSKLQNQEKVESKAHKVALKNIKRK